MGFFRKYRVENMHKPNILVICPLNETVSKEYAEHINYKPYLTKTNLIEWEQNIQAIKPSIIVINTEYFTREMMQIWRKYLPTQPIAIVRGGTSLSKCDLKAANDYTIQVFNTPGVNSKYVADYMNGILFREKSSSDRIAIIGVGNIGSRILSEAVDHDIDFVLYNKTKNLSFIPKEKFSPSLEIAMNKANKIAISLPLDASTRGIITPDIIAKIPLNAMVICVSPHEIFTNDALRALYQRQDIHVIFDDIPPTLEKISRIIGNPKPPRSNFNTVTKATASAECQNAMAAAAIEKSQNLLINFSSHQVKSKL